MGATGARMPRWLRVVGVLLALLAVPLVWALTPASSWVLAAIDALRVAGPAGMIAFGAMVVVSGPVVFSAELVMAASGFLYGPINGFLLAWVCVHGAALANLALARTLLRKPLRRRLGGSAVAAMDDLMLDQGLLVVMLLRLPPLAPFHVVSYALGLTPVRVRDAMLGTALGVIPQVALFAWLGSTVSDISGLSQANDALSPLLMVGIGGATIAVTVALTVIARRKLDEIKRRRGDAAADGGGGLVGVAQERPCPSPTG